jgi:hypothetical protein
MAIFFMTNVDYLDDRRYVRANAILRDAPNSYRTASSVTSQNLPAERSAPLGKIAIIRIYNSTYESFWQNEAKMINVFKGSHLLPRPTRASCD